MANVGIEVLAVTNDSAKVRVRANGATETLDFDVAPHVATALRSIVEERPFRITRPGVYSHWIISVAEATGRRTKTATVEIRKGRSRTKRELTISKPMFISLWNMFHSGAVPSLIAGYRRTR
jgi:hypothetical protein